MTKDAIVKQEGAGPLVVPDFLKGETGGEGFGNMDSKDVIIPRLCFTQALTPQKKKSNVNHIEGLTDGDMFNSVSGEIYGNPEKPIQVIPLQFTKSRIFFKDMTDGGGILCQSFNGVDGGSISPLCADCPNSKFDANGGTPACTLFNNYLSVILPQRELIVVSLKSSALKVARQWNARMKMLGNKPMFAGVYEIKLVETKNSKGEYFVPAITLKRFVNQDEFNYAKETFNNLSGKNVQIHQDDEQHTPEGSEEDIPF